MSDPQTPVSATPRTTALWDRIGEIEEHERPVVLAEHAEQLERELHAMTVDREKICFELAKAEGVIHGLRKQAAMDSECIERCQREGAKMEVENERLRAELSKLHVEVSALRQDKELLSELEAMSGAALVSDDFGNWAVTGSGFQSVPE